MPFNAHFRTIYHLKNNVSYYVEELEMVEPIEVDDIVHKTLDMIEILTVTVDIAGHVDAPETETEVVEEVVETPKTFVAGIIAAVAAFVSADKLHYFQEKINTICIHI